MVMMMMMIHPLYFSFSAVGHYPINLNHYHTTSNVLPSSEPLLTTLHQTFFDYVGFSATIFWIQVTARNVQVATNVFLWTISTSTNVFMHAPVAMLDWFLIPHFTIDLLHVLQCGPHTQPPAFLTFKIESKTIFLSSFLSTPFVMSITSHIDRMLQCLINIFLDFQNQRNHSLT